jgi:hypothetical protein
MDNQKKSGTIWQKKLYTQSEVNDLLEKQTTIKTEEKAKLNRRKVAKLVKRSNRILVSISTHAFPFDIFPDTVNIEESRVTIVRRRLLSSSAHSIDIRHISNVFINSSLFFFTTRDYFQNLRRKRSKDK